MRKKLKYHIHQTEGRLRIRMPNFKTDSVRKEDLLKSLLDLNGIQKVACSSVSGSLTIYFESELLNASAILQLIDKVFVERVHGFLDEREEKSNVIPFPLHRVHGSRKDLPKIDSAGSPEGNSSQLQKKIIQFVVMSALESTGKLILKKIFL